jgi:hypothetical protein
MTVLMEHRTCYARCPNFQLGRILEEIADYKKSFWQCGKGAVLGSRRQWLAGSCAFEQACPCELSYIGETAIFVAGSVSPSLAY